MHLATLLDWTPEQIKEVIDFGIEVKKNPEKYATALHDKTLAMLFQKTSTRTRVSFETGMTQLGGHAIYLDWRTTNFTLGSLKDETICLARWVDIIMARVYKHETIQEMCANSKVPVINGLCDKFHPTQILADLMTFKEHKGKFKGCKMAYTGDGNNICNSLIIGCSKAGLKISVATPKGYAPFEKAVAVGKKFGALELTNDPMEAVKGADAIYTDTWVSMGQEAETEKREKIFQAYQLNKKLWEAAGTKPLIMHDLPAHRGKEITDEMIDHKNSVIYDQAENRMHIEKAVMIKLLLEWK